MELKPGYKQTELGMIPEDWVVKPLFELFAFSGGYSRRAPNYRTKAIVIFTTVTFTEPRRLPWTPRLITQTSRSCTFH